MTRLLHVTPLMALALCACSKQESAPSPEGSGSDAAMVPGSGAHSEAAPAASGSAGPDTSVSSPVIEGPLEKSIPEPARGRWGLVPADCTTTRGDDKGLMTIAESRIKFYESIAVLDTVKERTATRIRATYAYEGEGMTWKRDTLLDVQDGGKTLILREYGDDAPAGPRRYTRCG